MLAKIATSPLTRRHFLQGAVVAGTMAVAAQAVSWADERVQPTMPGLKAGAAELALRYPFTLPELPYAEDALAPVIDAETMKIHHGKHHQAYIDKLNGALKENSNLQQWKLGDLLTKWKDLPESIRETVRNNAGGHANHTMFWKAMAKEGATKPNGELLAAITSAYGTVEAFQTKFNDAGAKQFGSGWVFLIRDQKGGVAIEARPNQDTPLMDGKTVLFGNDVWEHAYYITYRNRRPDYLKAWWKLVNWDAAELRFKTA